MTAQRGRNYRESHIGELDKGLDEAAAKDWTIMSMKNDWRMVFPSG